uniref:Amino acid transporter transmembrane domain-containing protein n=1 Tax=Alexandrium monilatum TaxID=311494 RepID=A0A7S4VNH9_9DINO
MASSSGDADYGSTSGSTHKLGLTMECGGYPDDSDLEDRTAKRGMSWQNAAWVINASVIGMGVLTIPSTFALLGWLVGLVSLVACLLANIIVAQVMMEVQELHPRAITLADAAQIASGGSRTVKVVFRSVLYAEKLACTCAYVTLMADTLGSVFYSVHWCEATWSVIIVVLFLPLMQLKNLQETFFLNIVNFVTILAVVILTCILVSTTPRTEPAITSWLPASDFRTAFGALSMLVFAYSGNWMYFELMAEMTEPKKFLKAFSIAGPTQVGLYALIGCVCYGVMGRSVPASVVEVLRFGPFMRAIAFLLTVHIICGTGTNIIVLIRFFHSRVSPQDVNEDTTRANVVRTVIYFCILSGTFLVSLTIGEFREVITLIGAMFEAPISFICPFVIYEGVMRGRPPRRTWSSRLVWVAAFLIAIFGVFVMIFGVIDAVAHLQHLPPRHSGLFSCNCEGLWDTCDCSRERMPAGACKVPASSMAELRSVAQMPIGLQDMVDPQREWLLLPALDQQSP